MKCSFDISNYLDVNRITLAAMWRIRCRETNIQEIEGKEIEENDRMGMSRDLFKKTSVTKGIFHENMGIMKNRDGIDLIKAEDIKKR